METEVELPDGRKILLEHEGELTEDAIKKVASQMGYEVPSSGGDTARDWAGEGIKIGGAIAGALKGAKKGPKGAVVGAVIGSGLGELLGNAVMKRDVSTGESVANVALSAIQPANKAANLATRLIRGGMIGSALGAGHKLTQTAIDEGRIARLEELAMPATFGAAIGGPLEGILGKRLPAPVAKTITPPATKEGSITASLDKRKPTSLAQANAEANEIATGKPANAPASAKATPKPVAQEPVRVSIDDEDAIEAAASAQAKPAKRANDKESYYSLTQEPGELDKLQKEIKDLGGTSILAPIVGKNTFSISNLELPKSLRGNGKGRKAIEAINKFADERGLSVEVNPNTPELAKFYEKFGYVRSGKSGPYVRTPSVGSPETIVSAAVKYSDGEIRTGKNHASIIDSNPDGDLRGSDDGFVTSTGRYVGREEAMTIAKKAGQVGETKGKPNLSAEHLMNIGQPLPRKGLTVEEIKPAKKEPIVKAPKALVATETPIVPEKPVKATGTPKKAIPAAHPAEPPPPAKRTAEAAPEGEKPIRRGVRAQLADESKPEQYKQVLKENPDIRYERKKHGDWSDNADSATDQELRDMIDDAKTGDEKAIYLRKLSNRLLAAGKNDEAQKLFVESTKLATPAGQMLHAMGMVRTAYGDLAEVESLAAKAGRNLTKEQKEKVLKMASDEIEAQKVKSVAEKKAKEFPSRENYQAFRDAELNHTKVLHEFDEYTQAIAPRELDEMIVKMIQGNLLTPLSIASNVYGNLIWSPVEKASTSIASLMDALVTTSIRGVLKAQGRDPKIFKRAISAGNPLPSSMELGAMADGVRVAAKELLTGPSIDSYVKAEVQRGFRPWRSLMDSVTGENLARGADGQVKMWDRIKAFAEGTAGVPPEIMFRLLSIGDKPFRRAASVRALLEQARIKGIKEADLEHFMMFPDAQTKEFVDKATRRAIFAEENAGITTVNRFLDSDMAKLLRVDKIPVLKGAMKVFGRLTVPFRQFPVNYALTALNFASPPLALAKSLYYTGKSVEALYKKGLSPKQAAALHTEMRRKGLINFAEATIGVTMYVAADILWDNGLISESMADTSAKRSDQAEMMGASKLNRSGLDRYLKGEDPAYRKGDDLVDWTRAGIPAVIFHIATQQKSKERQEAAAKGEPVSEKAGLAELIGMGVSTAPGLGKFIFDQSFLAGTSSLLEAIKDADPESPAFKNWMGNMFKAVSSVAVPNTIDAIARANMEYVPELRGKNQFETLANIWRHKTFGLPADERPLLFKRDTWGRKIPRTPAGADPYVYGLIDVTKSGKQLENRHDQALFDLYEQTERDSVYPDPVGRSLVFNKNSYELDPEDVEKMQETIGTLRRQRMEEFVDSRMYSRLDPMERVFALEKIYQGANKDGREKFISSNGIYQKYLSANPDKATVTSRSTESLLGR